MRTVLVDTQTCALFHHTFECCASAHAGSCEGRDTENVTRSVIETLAFLCDELSRPRCTHFHELSLLALQFCRLLIETQETQTRLVGFLSQPGKCVDGRVHLIVILGIRKCGQFKEIGFEPRRPSWKSGKSTLDFCCLESQPHDFVRIRRRGRLYSAEPVVLEFLNHLRAG